MKTFKDLKFERNPMMGWGAKEKFDNGLIISVQASEGHYCTPRENCKSVDDYEGFEIAIWDDNDPRGEWKTREFIPDLNDDVAACMDREEISAVMLAIQSKK